jgi:hypothetical protein
MLLPSEPPVNIVPNKDHLSPVREVALLYIQDPVLSILPITPELFFFKFFRHFSFFDHSLVRTGYLVSPLHVSWPKYPTHADFHHPSNTLWTVHATELLIMQFPLVPFRLSVFQVQVFLPASCSQIFSYSVLVIWETDFQLHTKQQIKLQL